MLRGNFVMSLWEDMGKFFTKADHAQSIHLCLEKEFQSTVLNTTHILPGLNPIDKGSLNSAVSESSVFAFSGEHPSVQVTESKPRVSLPVIAAEWWRIDHPQS